jgi:hypothetical protein
MNNMGYELIVSNKEFIIYCKRFLELWDAVSALTAVAYSEVYINSFEMYEYPCRMSSTICQVELTEDEVIALTPLEPIKKTRAKKQI